MNAKTITIKAEGGHSEYIFQMSNSTCENVFTLSGATVAVNVSTFLIPTKCEAEITALSKETDVRSSPLKVRVDLRAKTKGFDVKDLTRLNQHIWISGDIQPVEFSNPTAEGSFEIIRESCPGFYRISGKSLEGTATREALEVCSAEVALRESATGFLSESVTVETKIYGAMKLSIPGLPIHTIPGGSLAPVKVISDTRAESSEYSLVLNDVTCGNSGSLRIKDAVVKGVIPENFEPLECGAVVEAMADGKIVSTSPVAIKIDLDTKRPFRNWCRISNPSQAVASTVEAVRASVGMTSRSYNCVDVEAAARITRFLDLSFAGGFDARVLYAFADLRSLNLTSASGINPASLRGLSQLESVSLANTGLKSAPDLSYLPALRSLDLAENLFTTYSTGNTLNTGLEGLATLTNLVELNLNSTGISDLSALSQLSSLSSLSVKGNPISEKAFAGNMQAKANLKILNLAETRFKDVSVLSDFSNLEILDLSKTPVNNLAPLSALKSLRIATLHGTKVNDISPLANSEDLSVLDISGTSVSDLTSLAGLETLRMVLLGGSQVTAAKCPVDALSSGLSSACKALIHQ